MKQLLIFGLVVVLAISVYYDLTEGTLPNTTNGYEDTSQENSPVTAPPPADTLHYQEVIVQSGHTVYTIVKALHQDVLLDADFEKIVTDFEKLNPDVNAHDIRIGSTYRFPVYKETLQQTS
ncbi:MULTISPECIES: hypothetical protein [Alteribacter]|uniref:LysM domain-containing protein n=1 Tax=Alteribacter keqinensis TaxID=2483800 RepID=A0A3M7TWW3_9BACI|nr:MULTISPECIES: hypothetical protein [Alteribacter]MBM7097066.1 hypothetical protein [Alteribacter salitolerans]RNA68905.1 hypothetical protein EBO34_02770 [Alteribacter keqinensis]